MPPRPWRWPNAGGTSDFTVCLLVREREQGTTCFGEAAIETLRRNHTPEVVADTHEHPNGTLREVDLVEQNRDRIRTLRLYGVGGVESLNDTLALMRLEQRQALGDRNTHEMFLPRGAVVELWACTAGSADVSRVITHDGIASRDWWRASLPMER